MADVQATQPEAPAADAPAAPAPDAAAAAAPAAPAPDAAAAPAPSEGGASSAGPSDPGALPDAAAFKQALESFRSYINAPHGALYDTNVAKAEQAAGVKREMFFYGAFGLFSAYLICGSGARFASNFFLLAFASAYTFPALRQQERSPQAPILLTFYLLFGVFAVLDSALYQVPAYFVFKVLFLLAVGCPETRVANTINARVLQPIYGLVQARLA